MPSVASKGTSTKEKLQEEYSDLDTTDDGKDYCKYFTVDSVCMSPQKELIPYNIMMLSHKPRKASS